MRLFWIELNKVLLSIPFIVYAAAVVLFNFTQYHEEIEKIEPPQPNLAQYGIMQKDDPSLIMPSAMDKLAHEIEQNSFITYPLGFYKEVTLSEEKLTTVQALASTLNMTLTYTAFKETMGQINSLLGGGSSYSEKALVSNFGYVEMSYEDARQGYDNIVLQDRYTSAYARYFADYMGIMLAVLPAFIAVAISLKDKQARMTSLIYSRHISTTRLIGTRYAAMVIALFAPIVLLAVYETTVIYSMYPEAVLKPFAFVLYSIGWLLPTIMFVVALALCLTEWTGTPIAIAVQLVVFFASLQLGMTQMQGGYGQGMLSIRHNVIGATDTFMSYQNVLLWNRLSYVCISILLLALSIWIYEGKRRGMRTSYEWVKQAWHHYRR